MVEGKDGVEVAASLGRVNSAGFPDDDALAGYHMTRQLHMPTLFLEFNPANLVLSQIWINPKQLCHCASRRSDMMSSCRVVKSILEFTQHDVVMDVDFKDQDESTTKMHANGCIVS